MPKELLMNALRHKQTDAVPWVPFAGVHAGLLVGATATEMLTDEETMYRAVLEANRLYKPDGQPVLFDLQLEAEILGCELVWVDDCPPSVKTHPLEETQSVPCQCTLPTEADGRLPLVLNVMRRLKAEVGETTALFGLVCGPFTLASHLRGNELFMDMYDDEDFVAGLLEYCAECARRVAGYYIGAGMDVIAVVDPLVSQISAAHFEQFLTKPYSDIFAFLREKEVGSSFFVCGDATRNVEVMCQTKPDSIFVDENVSLPEAKAITDRYGVALGGNIPLTSVMLYGTQQDNMKYTVDLLDAIQNHTGLIIAPGCDMPYATPPENTSAVELAVHNPETARDMLKNYVAVKEDIHVDLPDYTALSKPLVEVFTLDSATCAACTYMMGAADAAKAEYGDAIDMVEYKYTVRENIARCVAMGVQKLPSIYINGKLAFSSLIPSREELNAAIDAAVAGIKG